MGRFLGPLTLILAALLPGPAARAQPWCCPADPWAGPPVPAPLPYDPLPPFPAIELLGGQASGVRLQVPVIPGPNGNGAVVAEGFYGHLSHDLGESWALGAGGRFLWREPLDCSNSIIIGPGVSVFFHLEDEGLILLTPSIDLAWMHSLSPGVALEIGVEGALGIGLTGRAEDGTSAVGEVTPIISGYIGLRF